MNPQQRPLLVLHPDPVFRSRLSAAAAGEFRVSFVRCWEALASGLEEARAGTVVVVHPYESGRNATLAPRLRAVLSAYPSVPVLAALEVTPRRFDDLRALGEWGVLQVISIGHDDTHHGIRQRLKRARGRPLRQLLENVLPPDLPSRTRTILEAAAEVTARGGQGTELARQLYMSRRSLHRWCERAHLPEPRSLLAWMRLLQAAELLDDPGRPILNVSMVCGYASDSGLRRIAQKLTGESPSELRERGAFARASAEFLRVLTSRQPNGGAAVACQ